MTVAPSGVGVDRTQPVTVSMTVVIHRVLAGYCAYGLVASAATMVAQLPTTAWWWTAVFVPLLLGVVTVMLVRAVRRQPIESWAAAYAATCLVALASGCLAFAPRGSAASWLWWLLGQGVVAAGVWGGVRVAAGYALVLAVVYGVLRTQPGFGGCVVSVGVSDGLFIVVAGLPIAATAIGMIRAGETADRLAADLARRELDAELGRAMAAERSRLDRLIHDDVLTTLTAAAHADDPITWHAARQLAVTTLQKVDALQTELRPHGRLPGDVVVRLAQELVLRVSPSVELSADSTDLGDITVSGESAEALLAATREAVRNAVHHAGAGQITVLVRLDGPPAPTTASQPVAPTAELVFVVVDDGRGFVPDAVDERRLGLRLSILGRLGEVGGRTELDSQPGAGTTLTLAVPAADGRPVAAPAPALTAPAFPADFPVGLLTRLTWFVIAVQMAQGLYYRDQMAHSWASLLAMVPTLVALGVLLHGGPVLRLPRWGCLTVVVTLTAAGTLSAYAQPRDNWPGYGLWLPFVLQLLVVITVLRQRLGTAVFVYLGAGLPLAGWALSTPYAVAGLSTVQLSVAVFGVMAWFVDRGLQGISRRQDRLRRQEAEALRQVARRYVGRVQRSLWADDLRAGASGLLHTVAAADTAVPASVQAECLVVEATLRESLVARNVMSEELAELTEDARRRGVSVTFVDSRRSAAPPAVGRAVVAEIVDALRRDSVSRVVVRLAPDEADQAASVVTAGGTDTSFTAIDRRGVRRSDDG